MTDESEESVDQTLPPPSDATPETTPDAFAETILEAPLETSPDTQVTLPHAGPLSATGEFPQTTADASTPAASEQARIRPSGGGEPTRYGEFEIVREIARGGMGVVYLARHVELGRQVALKVLLAGQQANRQELERFQIEARAAARLKHPNIVGIHHVGEESGRPYMVMDFIEGQSLRDLIRSRGTLGSKDAAWITEQLAQGLAYAHSRSILHRDMKPANVLMAPLSTQTSGEMRTFGTPVITDFGLAKDVEADSGLTRSGQAMGTPAYMPPEQADGNLELVDRRADVYSLGATLYECLTGKPPFTGGTVMKVIANVLEKDPVPPRRLIATVDEDLETICLKCLEKEPAHRYLSAHLLAEDLGRYLKDEPILARPPTLTERARKWRRRNRALASTIGLGLLVAFVIGVTATGLFLRELQARNERILAQKLEVEREQANTVAAKELAERRRKEAEEEKERALELQRRAELTVGQALEEKGLRAASRKEWLEAALYLTAALNKADGPRRRGEALRALANAWTAHPIRGSVAAWAPDGKLLAVGMVEGRVRLHDPQGRVVQSLAGTHHSPITALAWSPDGQRLASGTRGETALGAGLPARPGAIRLWRRKGKLLATRHNAAGGIRELAWSPDSRRLLSRTDERKAVARLWDADGKLITTLQARDVGGLSSWSRPSGRFALEFEYRKTAVFAGDSGRRLAIVPSPQMSPGTLSPDGSRLASRQYVYRVDDIKQKVALDQSSWAGGMEWSPDGSRLVGRWDIEKERDDGLAVWDATSGKRLASWAQESFIGWSPDGEKLLTKLFSGNALRLRDGRTGRPLLTLKTGEVHITDASWSPAGDRVTCAAKDGMLRIWDAHAGEHLTTLRIPGYTPQDTVSFLWSPRGDRLLTTCGGSVLLWSPARLPLVTRIDHEVPVVSAVWSPAGKQLATAAGTTIRLWESWSGKPQARLETGTRVQRMAYSADGSRIASAPQPFNKQRDRSVQLWDTRAGKRIARLSGHRRPVRSLHWSPKGGLLLTSTDRGLMDYSENEGNLWDGKSGIPRGALEVPWPKKYAGVRWSPDGAWLAAVQRDKLLVWSKQGGAPRQTQMTHGKRVRIDALEFSPDGGRLATTGWDGNLRIWDVRSGQQLRAIEHPVRPSRPRWSPDGTRILTRMQYGWGKLTLWDARSGEQLAQHLGRAEGQFHAEAWSRDGARLAYAHGKIFWGRNQATLHLLDGRSGKRIGALGAHQGMVRFQAFTPDGKHLASASEHGLHVRDRERLLAIVPGERAPAGWSPDGTRLMCLSRRRTIHVWPVETFRSPPTVLLSLARRLSSARLEGVVLNDPTDLAKRARDKLLDHDYEGAIRDLGRALRPGPREAELRLLRGRANLQLGYTISAASDFSVALELRPDAVDILLVRGLAHVALGRRRGILFSVAKEAIADFDRVLKLRPRHAQALCERGVARRAAQDLKGARADFDAALRAHPDHAVAWFERAELRAASGDLEGAISDYTRALQLRPARVAVRLRRGRTRLRAGKFSDAIRDGEAILRARPHSALGLLLTAQGRIGRRSKGYEAIARADLTRAIQLEPRDRRLWVERAKLHAAAGRWKEALADLGQALVRFPSYLPRKDIPLRTEKADVHCLRAKAQLQLGERVAASRDVRAALRLVRDHAQAKAILAELARE